MNALGDIPVRPLQRASSACGSLAQGFTPNWFAVTMGTGALALAVNQLPWVIPGRREIAQSLWLLDVCIFACCALLYATHWALHRNEAQRILEHPVLSGGASRFRSASIRWPPWRSSVRQDWSSSSSPAARS